MNRFTKTISYIVIISALCLSTISYTKDPIPMPSPGAMPGMPQMSQAEMQQLEAELAQLNQMLEGLSEEEQAQVLDSMVQEAMEEVKKDLSDEGKELLDKLETGDITDDDFNKLLNELMPQDQQKKDEPVPAKPLAAPKAEAKMVITSKHQAALDLINSLINRTNLVIQKATSIPELPGTIRKWHRKKKIEWQPNLTWNTFRSDLDSFVSKLEKLKEQDPKTQNYIHLDAFVKDETLYNNLSKVEKMAVEYEPKLVEIAPIGRPKVPEDSKKALQKLLTQYNEALYVLKLNQAIDALFTLFEPKAKALREVEEQAAQAAQAEMKKERRPGRAVTGGFPERDYTPPFDDMYEDYYPMEQAGSQEAFIPTYEPPKQDSFLPTSRSPRQSRDRSGGSSGAQQARGKKGEKEKSAFNGKDEQVDFSKIKNKGNIGENTRISKSGSPLKTEPQKNIDAIADSLKSAASLIDNNSLLNKDLKDEVTKSGSYSKTLVENLLPDLDADLRKALRSINSFNNSIKNKPTNVKKEAKKLLNTAVKKTMETIKKLNTSIDEILAIQDSVSLEKTYLYVTDNMVNYIGTHLSPLIPNNANKEILATFVRSHEYDLIPFLKEIIAAYIAQVNPDAAIQTQLTNLANEMVNDYLAISEQVSRPVRLSAIKQTIKQLEQSLV